MKRVLDNIVAVEELNNKEKQFRKSIDAKRGRGPSGNTSYRHKDGTNVIVAEYPESQRYKNPGFDVVLVRGDDYLHFETTADNQSKNGELNVIIGNFNSSKQQKRSYPMDAEDAVSKPEKMGEVLAEKAPNLAETFNEYVPGGTGNVVFAALDYVYEQEQKKKGAFDNAFLNWKNNGR